MFTTLKSLKTKIFLIYVILEIAHSFKTLINFPFPTFVVLKHNEFNDFIFIMVITCDFFKKNEYSIIITIFFNIY